MNILFICNEYPPGKSGGIGSMTRVLARGLVAAGHTVLVAGLYVPGYGEKDYEEDQGVKVWRKRSSLDIGLIRNDYSRRDTAILKLLQVTGIRGWDVRRSLLAFHSFLLDLIAKFKIDIIEWPDFNEYFPYLPQSFSWPSLPVPLVVKFHGTTSNIARHMQETLDSLTLANEKKHIDRADALLAISRYTAQCYGSLYGIHRPVEVLYNSIDLPKNIYRPAEVQPTIVFTGTLTRLKGIYSLLKAWNDVHRICPDARLRIFGKGKIHLFEPLLDKASGASVVFEGFATRDQLFEAYSTAAAAIFPSYVESFAMAPLEAMAVGCPVIFTTRASGPELIEQGKNGLMVDPDDIRQIVDSILVLLRDADLRARFSINGRKTIEQRFDIRKSIHDHILYYEKQISNYTTESNV